MPSHDKKKLIEYEHISLRQPQYCPHQPDPSKYGKNSDKITPEVESQLLNKSDNIFVHQVLGSFLYYACTIDLTILHALSAIALDQSNPTERTMKSVHQLFDYMHINPYVVIRFYAFYMILNEHSDASYMSAACTCNRACEYFSLVECLVMAHQSNSTIIPQLREYF